MKLISKLLILVAPWSIIMLTQTTASSWRDSDVPKASKAQLQVTTDVVGQVSCSPDHLGLRLRLTFRNAGEEAVILHKRSAVSRLMVSSDLSAAFAQKYEEELRYDDPSPDIGLESHVFSGFRVLKSGEVFEVEERASLYLSNGKRNSERFLLQGTHFLQVDVGTWPYVADPKPFRKKWRDKGYLWYEGLTSVPMPFKIDPNRPITKCP